MYLRPHQHCVDCEFFAEIQGPLSDKTVLEISEKEREASRKNDYTWVLPGSVLACERGVWHGGNIDKGKHHREIVEVNRRGFCFWWKNRPGMLTPAAEILQKREEDERHASRDRRLTIVGLWIAALALLANVCLTLAGKLKLWPFH